jgi:hypothetical protein
MTLRVRACYQATSFIEDLEVDAAAELLDEVSDHKKLPGATKSKGEHLTSGILESYAVGLFVTWQDISLPEDGLLGVRNLEIGLGTQAVAREGDKNEQLPAIDRCRPVPLTIAPDAVKRTAGHWILREPRPESVTRRGPVRPGNRACVRCHTFTSTPGNEQTQEKDQEMSNRRTAIPHLQASVLS